MAKMNHKLYGKCKKIISAVVFGCTFLMIPIEASIEIEESYSSKYGKVLEIKDTNLMLQISAENGLIIDINDVYYDHMGTKYAVRFLISLLLLLPCFKLDELMEKEQPRFKFIFKNKAEVRYHFARHLIIRNSCIEACAKVANQRPLLKWFLEKNISNKILLLLGLNVGYCLTAIYYYSGKNTQARKDYANKLYNDLEHKLRINKTCLEKGCVVPYWPSLVRLTIDDSIDRS
jgi:hypothetical protein